MRTRRTPLVAAVLAATALLSGCSDGAGTAGQSPTTSAATTAPGSPETTAPASSAGGRVPVVLDYSPTVSDVAALLYLAEHPDVDLLAVTLAGTGESHCGAGVANTVALLDLVGPLRRPGRLRPDGAHRSGQRVARGVAPGG